MLSSIQKRVQGLLEAGHSTKKISVIVGMSHVKVLLVVDQLNTIEQEEMMSTKVEEVAQSAWDRIIAIVATAQVAVVNAYEVVITSVTNVVTTVNNKILGWIDNLRSSLDREEAELATI